MAQPQYRDSITTGYLGPTDYTPLVPIESLTFSAGDWLWLMAMDDADAKAIDTPAGWTAGIDVLHAQGCSSRWFYKVATGSETNFEMAQMAAPIIHLVSVNPNGGTISIVASPTSSNAASATSTTATTAGAADALVLVGFVNDDNMSVATPPATMTVMEVDPSAGCALASYYEEIGTGDFTRSLVWSSSGGVHAHAVVLTSAAAGGLSIPIAMSIYAQQ